MNATVVKSITRKYGYSLKWIGKNPPSWIVGVNHTWAWYRYKRDALKAAERYNNPEPKDGDYVQLLDASGKPSENHARVSRVLGELGTQLYLVEDQQGESFAITRLPEYDTDVCKAWQQVITATA